MIFIHNLYSISDVQLFSWRESVQFLSNFFPQYLQIKFFTGNKWVRFICWVKLSALLNVDPQMLHLLLFCLHFKSKISGLLTPCIVSLCLFKCLFNVKFCPHLSHTKGSLFVWLSSIWASRYLRTENSFAQSLHLNPFSSSSTWSPLSSASSFSVSKCI